jgi:hypothetical protein
VSHCHFAAILCWSTAATRPFTEFLRSCSPDSALLACDAVQPPPPAITPPTSSQAGAVQLNQHCWKMIKAEARSPINPHSPPAV